MRIENSVCYHLGYGDGAITIEIAKPCFEAIAPDLKPEGEYIAALREELSLPAFIPPSTQTWGYGPVFATRQAKNDWIKLVCKLPVAKVSRQSVDMYEARAASASLNVLFLALWTLDTKLIPPSREKQLMLINEFRSAQEMKGYLLGAEFSLTLYKWLEGLASLPEANTKLEQALTKAMRDAHSRMYQGKDKDRREEIQARNYETNTTCYFLSSIGGGGALTAVPGNLPESQEEIESMLTYGLGVPWDSDNIDDPGMQLVLLAGLAKTCDLARRANLF